MIRQVPSAFIFFENTDTIKLFLLKRQMIDKWRNKEDWVTLQGLSAVQF
jgi:hypothetical protein